MSSKQNLIKKLGNYFLGIGRHKKYHQQRNFYAEFETDPKARKWDKASTYFHEALDIGITRIGVTAVSLTVLYESIAQRKLDYLVGMGVIELCRALCHITSEMCYKKNKETTKRVKRSVSKSEDFWSGRDISQLMNDEDEENF